MTSTEIVPSLEVTREELRTFYLSGRGIEHAAPGSALRPAALDRIADVDRSQGWTAQDGPQAATLLHITALLQVRQPARRRFRERLKSCREGLTELLAQDDRFAPQTISPERLMASLGNSAGLFFDTGVLTEALKRRANPLRAMEPERRDRCERALAALNQALRTLEGMPAFWMVHSGEAPAGISTLGGKARHSVDWGAAALELCDEQLDWLGGVLRAMRRASLEIGCAYDPRLHEEGLKRIDWQMAEPDELAALAPVVVQETTEHLAGSASFWRLLRSGRPIQILATCAGFRTEDLSELTWDAGFAAVAQREVFVLQSSPARWQHLHAGLEKMAATHRTAVAVVSAPQTWTEAVALCESRAFPLFEYDPDGGEGWAERFKLEPVQPAEGLTVADAVATAAEFRRQFRIISKQGWDEEQRELSEYLKDRQPAPALPFIWVKDEDGTLQRAAVSRNVVNLTRDRLQAWRMLEDLASPRSAPVEVVDEEGENRARMEGARQAVYRVIAMLTGGETAATPAASEPVAAAAPAARSEPYIDSYLCTSCNDCMKINSRLFQYDANKQAHLGDVRAGTFAELVKAAEGCPGRCIHPGAPRPDDPTVTPQLLARAAKLR